LTVDRSSYPKQGGGAAIFPIVLSGGRGTRLWPLSRAMYPKQFNAFFDGQGESFFAATLQRLKPASGFEFPIILCNNDYRFLVREDLERTGIEPKAIILEPVARNTAAAVAVAALAASAENPDAILAVMPSDHVLRDGARFVDAVKVAATVAASGKLVLFGITPTKPHTGYGYIRTGSPLMSPNDDVFEVENFVEKPDLATAQTYVDSGDYYWNSGIFILHARTLLEEMETLQPDILKAARDALAGAQEDLGFLRLEQTAFSRAPSISIDHAIMEKTTAAAMMPLDIGWNDVGSWSSLWEIGPHDAEGNFVHGEAILEDSSGCYVHTDKALVSTIGVKDLVIVSTRDALLIADKGQSEKVSDIVAKLKQSNRKEQEQHVRNHRPWGYFESLSVGPRFQVKLLHVNPGGKLSMQMHHHRSEHWVVVQGTAKVTIGDVEQLIQENESVYITATQWHRLENPGKVPLEIIEVQIGTYLSDDDIIRRDDVYHRAPDETK